LLYFVVGVFVRFSCARFFETSGNIFITQQTH
jgi:hypothetical protein